MFGRLSKSERESLREYLLDGMSVIALFDESLERYAALVETSTPPVSAAATLYHSYRLVTWDQLEFERAWEHKIPRAARKDYEIQAEGS